MTKAQREKLIRKTFSGTKLMKPIEEIFKLLEKIQKEQRLTIKMLDKLSSH